MHRGFAEILDEIPMFHGSRVGGAFEEMVTTPLGN
jgi:hypothetical protein